MHRYLDEASGCAGRAYGPWLERIAATRRHAAAILGATPEEVAFVKSTTAGLQIVAHSLRWRAGDVIVVEEATFPANWYVWKALEGRHGVRVVVWKARDGVLEVEDLRALMRDHPVRLVSLSAVSYATGERVDLDAVGSACRESGALFCVDAIQVLGMVPFDVNRCGADFVSADSHKWLMGPEGVGVFYCRRERLELLDDSFCGWIGRENFLDFDARDLAPDPTARRFEEGAPNWGYQQAMGASLELLCETGMEAVGRRVTALADHLRAGLEDAGWTVVSPSDPARRSAIIAARPGRGRLEDWLARFGDAGIVCLERRGAIRMAPHFYQTAGEMDAVLELARGAC
jgi:selenocysteine lyase/cysteine desulfurase